MPESRVAQLDLKDDSAPIFASKLADIVFPEEELRLLVDDRDIDIFNWIVEVRLPTRVSIVTYPFAGSLQKTRV